MILLLLISILVRIHSSSSAAICINCTNSNASSNQSENGRRGIELGDLSRSVLTSTDIPQAESTDANHLENRTEQTGCNTPTDVTGDTSTSRPAELESSGTTTTRSDTSVDHLLTDGQTADHYESPPPSCETDTTYASTTLITTNEMNAINATDSTTLPSTSAGGKSLGFTLGLALGLGVPTGVAAVGSFLYFWKIYRPRHGRVNIMHS